MQDGCSAERRTFAPSLLPQYRIIDAAALGPVEKQAHGHGRQRQRSSLYSGCDFSGSISTEAPPQTPLVELTALPQKEKKAR